MKEKDDEKDQIIEKEEKKEKEETINIKLNFYYEQIDIQINSDYNSFINNICNILQLTKDKLDSLAISYYDEDKDSIILATEEDYALYLQQLKEKIVDSINIEIKDDSEIEPLECFGSALDYQDQINKSNNHIKNDSINIINNKVEENHINSSININDNIINNNDINNSIQNKDEINDYDIKVEDIVFYYKCTSCSIYPIICSLYYCPQCPLYVCEDCIKNFGNHIHGFQKFESNIELMKVKEKENIEIENMNQIKNNENIFNNINQNNINNNINNNNNNINNNNYNDNMPWESSLFRRDSPEYGIFQFFSHIPHPLKSLRESKMRYFFKKNRGMLNYLIAARKARKKYNLEGIDDFQIIEALKKTGGDIDKAIPFLIK
jgi:hypothetical protein